jgi:hypothetical protein
MARVIVVNTLGPQGPPGPQGPAGTGSFDTGSFATTGSNAFVGNQTISGSLFVTGSVIISGSNTFTNIGPAIFSGSVSISGSTTINGNNVLTTANTGSLNVLSSSYASTASYVNTLNQNVSIIGNLDVIGTASFTYTTQSIINVGAGFINLNTDFPAARFGGINVFDSGSFGNSSTGSLLWDSLNNRWIYSNPSGSSYSGGMLISGPRNTGSVGNEQGTTLNALMKGQGGDHITSSGIFEDASGSVTFGNNLMYVSSSGLVGIGTSTPAYHLDLYGTYHQYQAQGRIARYDISSANANQNRGVWDFYTNAAATPDFFGRFGFKFEGGTTDSFKQFQVHIADSTTPKFIVNGSGRVGIGTIAPSAPLEVVGNTLISGSITQRGGGIYLYDINGYGGGRIYGSYNYLNGEILISPSSSLSDNFVFSPNNGMSIGGFTIGGTTGSPPAYGLTVSGSIGIGTRVPAARLHISGSTSQALLVVSSSAGPALFVSGSGNVGIGTTTPAVKFTIQQSNQVYSQIDTINFDMAVGIAANSSLISGLDFKNFNNAGQVRLMARNDQNDYLAINSYGSAASGTLFGVNRTNLHALFAQATSDATKKLAIGTFNAGDLILGTNNTERARIFANGNVAIGTTTDAGYKLDVSGSAKINDGIFGLGTTGNILPLISTAGTGTVVVGGTSPNTPALRFQGSPLNFFIGSTQVAQFFATTGNLLLQNGGTFTDAGYRLDVSGSGNFTNGLTVTGSIISTLGFTGSLQGTASYAIQALSASYAPTLATFPYTGSAQITGSLGVTGSTSIQGTFNQGSASLASGLFSYVQGLTTTASGIYSHAEGDNTKASGSYSHAEGLGTIASGSWSHAEGNSTQAIGDSSHAEGSVTQAIGESSHAEGDNTQAIGNYSHTEGQETIALGQYSHAEGYNTITSASYQHVQGQWNATSPIQSAFIVGNGTDDSNRSNLIYAAGNEIQISGSLSVSGSIIQNGTSLQALSIAYAIALG